MDRNVPAGARRWRLPGSYPARGTWIEIATLTLRQWLSEVVPRTGYVDRNGYFFVSSIAEQGVVPRTGYVDRNNLFLTVLSVQEVVPRTGYVDRNAGLAE